MPNRSEEFQKKRVMHRRAHLLRVKEDELDEWLQTQPMTRRTSNSLYARLLSSVGADSNFPSSDAHSLAPAVVCFGDAF